MASLFKTFLNNDIATTRTLLNEAIPITGTLVSGTYGTFGSEQNVKNYSHGMFQSVFDYPYLSASSNHIFDITAGFAPDSALSASTPNTQQEKKINIYNQMAQILVGYDATGSIQRFDQDGDLLSGGTKHREVLFMNFSRLLVKDEIKKGSFSLQVGSTNAFATSHGTTKTITDAGAENEYFVNSPAGEYGLLSESVSGYVGLIYYQAGVAVLTASVFGSNVWESAGNTIQQSMSGSNISVIADGLRHRVVNCQFSNTTELNSTIYFCRLNSNEFNYSSNPTYVDGSKIRVKNNSTDAPVSYISTVGLYSQDNALLALAKLSEPLRKDNSTELILRVRLDY